MKIQQSNTNLDFLKSKYYKRGKWETNKYFNDLKQLEEREKILKTTLAILKNELENKNKNLKEFIEKIKSAIRKNNPYFYRTSFEPDYFLSYNKLNDAFKINGYWSISKYKDYLKSFPIHKQEPILLYTIQELKSGNTNKRTKGLKLFISKLEKERINLRQIRKFTETPKIIVNDIGQLIRNFNDMNDEKIIDSDVNELAKFIFNNFQTGYKNFRTLKNKISEDLLII